MLYKPNFCCQCGDAIERVEWKPWTSRRFCENCETHFRQSDWIPRFISFFAIIGGLFGIGSFVKPAEKPLSLTSNQFTISSANQRSIAKKEESSINTGTPNSAAGQSIRPNVEVQKNQAGTKVSVQQNLQNQAEDPVYYCGAQTKKGTPCTRKVKGEGRCWQHTGLPAVLPKEKLRVS